MENTPQPQPPAARAKTGSPKFPQISLGTAIEKAKIIWEAEGKHPCRINALAQHWGSTAASSTLRSYIGAFMHFGLFDKTGQLEQAEFRLSPLALQILLGTEEERLRALRKAVLEPRLYSELWSKFQGELPSDANLLNRLMLDYGLSREAAPRFLKDFRDSIALAKLDKPIEATGENEIDLGPDDKQHGEGLTTPPVEPVRTRVQGPNPPFPPTPPRAPIDKGPPLNPTLRYLPIPLDIGDAPIPVGMSEDDFDLLLETLQLWKRKIVADPDPYKGRYPLQATWRNADSDKPVTIVAFMGSQQGRRWFQSEDRTGIPEDELEFTVA